MNGSVFKDIDKLETDLWSAADNLRANSKLTSSDYFMPVLGIIFLRHAANRYEAATRQIKEDQDAGRMPKRKIVDADYVRRRALPLPQEPWPTVCDVSTFDPVETKDWSDSDNRAIQRHFTQLLNLCLARRVSPMGMHYLKDAEALYFKASKPVEGCDVLPTRTKSYKSRKLKATRKVFNAYFSRADPTRVAYYRHVGFQRRFRRIGGKWFLEINPTYHYTTDGHQPHPFREEYLSKIKVIEGNNAGPAP